MHLLLVAVILATGASNSCPFVGLGHRRINNAWDQADDPFNFEVVWYHDIWPRHVVEELSCTDLPNGGKLEWLKDAHASSHPPCGWCFDVKYSEGEHRMPSSCNNCISGSANRGWDVFRITFDREAYAKPYPVFEPEPLYNFFHLHVEETVPVAVYSNQTLLASTQ
jgi:hypothetical protein